eukprot:scaffold382788_cov48-Prasinocladus_malaysianus.AAC.1
MPSAPHFKTQICRYWQQDGACSAGDKCTFAHGASELQDEIVGAPEAPAAKKSMNLAAFFPAGMVDMENPSDEE